MLKKVLYAFAVVIFITSLAFAGYFYVQYQQSQKMLKDPTLATKQETASIVAKVGNLMELPKNEQPTLATVADVSKLKGQEFFAKAKNGDKMLIYSVKKEIILYRPSTNKIINIAPITFNNAAQTGSPTPSISGTKESPSPTSKPTTAPTIGPTAAPTISLAPTDSPTP